MNVACINVRSLTGNYEVLKDAIIHMGYPEVICLQETWKVRDFLKLEIEGYRGPFISQRMNRNGGGVGIYVAKDIRFNIKKTLFEEGILETIGIDIELKGSKLKIINCYRPPSDKLEGLAKLKYLVEGNKNAIFMGDFNIDTLKINRYSNKLKNMMQVNGYANIINEATRLESNTCLDHIWAEKVKLTTINGQILNLNVSDHQILRMVIDNEFLTDQVMEKRRYFNNKMIVKLNERMLGFAVNDGSVNEMYNALITRIEKEMNDIKPNDEVKKKNKRIIPINEWMTRELLKNREKLQKLTLKVKGGRLDLKDKLASERKSYKNNLKAAKERFIFDKLNSVKNNTKKTWEIANKVLFRKEYNNDIGTITYNGKEIENSCEKAKAFGIHFETAAKALKRRDFNLENHKKYLTGHNNYWDIKKVNTVTVFKVIKNLKNKSSTGYDDISNRILKGCAMSWLPSITKIVNKSIEEGEVPDGMKKAKVIPLYKKGDHTKMDNYRPVSLLPVISKVLEKIIVNQLELIMDERNLIHGNQFGFKKRTSTIHANIKLSQIITKALNEKKKVGVVLIDVKKAFDSCDHRIIVNKIKHLGGGLKICSWITDYLKNRTQSIHVKGKKSKNHVIDLGVGQGTVLGPLLFKIYIHDLHESTGLIPRLFADDTTLICIGNNVIEIENVLNREIIKVNKWFNDNGLTLHPEKTNLMIFGTKQRCNVCLNGVKVNQCGTNFNTKTINVLGINWDESMKWDKHIEKVKSKMLNGIFLLKKFKKMLPLNCKKLIYNSLIRSHYLYGLTVWGGSSKIDVIEKVQKKAIRQMFVNKIHTEPIMKSMGFLKIKDEYKVQIGKLARDIVWDKGPQSLKYEFHWKDIIQRTRLIRNVEVTRWKSELLRRQITSILEKEINKVDRTTGFDKNWQREIKEIIIEGYRNQINCNNIGCIECY